MIGRRAFAAGLALPALSPSAFAAASAPSRERHPQFTARLRQIERRSGGRLGVCIVDSAGDGDKGNVNGNGKGNDSVAEFAYRPDERFLMCSTFKLMASTFVLRRVDLGQESLERVVPYTAADLVAYSPVTSKHADGAGMTMGALCEATITTSDNTAANLILASYGGPAGLTAFLRSAGDNVTRLDRNEPALNTWKAGDPRDTTTPRAMAASMRRAVVGDLLKAASRETLQRWLVGNTTGATRLRAGLPSGWRIGDKTGTSGTGTVNDIGVVWPPGRAPLLVAAYLTESRAANAVLERALAEVGEAVAWIVAG